MERFLQRERLSEDRTVKDPRTEEERVHASDLLKLVLVSKNGHVRRPVVVLPGSKLKF